MISDTENLERFIARINETADRAVEAIRRDTEKYVAGELEKAKKQASREIHDSQFTELDKLNEKNNTDIFAAQRRESIRLIEVRRALTDQIFDEVRRRIGAFTRTADYTVFLTASARRLADVVGADSVFYLREEDMKYRSDLQPYCREIKIDSELCLGGIRAVSRTKGLSADDTLDARLREQREAFYENSGLSVTL